MPWVLPANLGEVVRDAHVSEEAVRKLDEILRKHLRIPRLASGLRKLYDRDYYVNETLWAVCTQPIPENVLSGPAAVVWAYIQTIACRCVAATAEHDLDCEHRSIDHEVPLGGFQPLSAEPSPEDALARKETEEWLREQVAGRPCVVQEILWLLLQGGAPAEIAARLHVSCQRVYRERAWLEQLVRRRLG